MTKGICRFEELRVYQAACDLDFAIFVVSKSFPRSETYSLTDQIRRSSRSVGANIAEAWGKRRYVAHFVSKLTDADAELQETRHWLQRANLYGYLPDEELCELLERCAAVGGMLGSMIHSPSGFLLHEPLL